MKKTSSEVFFLIKIILIQVPPIEKVMLYKCIITCYIYGRGGCMPDYFLTEPQSDFFHAEERYVAAVAGFGAGKTAAAVSRIMTTKLKYPTVDLAYLAPSYGLIRDIFYPYMAEILTDMNIRFNINKGEHNIYIQGHGKIFCRTMERPDMLVGWQAGDAFMDEFDLLPTKKAETVIRKLSARLRVKFPDGKKNQRFITTTPEGFKATYKLFKKDPIPDSRLVQMSTYSNPHLPDDYIQGLIDLYPEQLIKAYLNGEFVNLVSGAVYYAFDRECCHTDRVIHKGEPLHIGMDFNVGKMSAVIFVDGLNIVDELIGYYDTPDLINAIQEKYDGHKIYVYPDAAGKNRNTTGATTSDHKQLKLAGFTVRALKANPMIKERVQSVNKVWQNGEMKINTEKCPSTTEAFEQQIYKGGIPDKSQDLDHPIDGAGYRVCKTHLISKPKINYSKVA